MVDIVTTLETNTIFSTDTASKAAAEIKSLRRLSTDCRLCARKLSHKHRCTSTLVCKEGSQFMPLAPLQLWKGQET